MGAHATDHDDSETDGPKVLSVSPRNPRVRTIQIHRPAPQDASFLAATAKGLGVTLRHFFKNVLRGKDHNYIETVEYPEKKVDYPERFRGLHRLMHRDDGAVRCVACMCCPTVCPAHCITIVPAQTDDKGIEKFPAVFEIDELRCVVCGLCVEACPCDAIRMDTGEHAKPVEERHDAVMTKDALLELGARSTAVQGGEGAAWRERK
ncbi:MAG: NADH-quinone oxidoreductase subunit I [Kofleriaceae bacterium]|nr:NADH-quinone oxidoreductase subunit I [Myxococcales bacterium]MCB9560029.1 NADH-quinone oxidoreductase subunit I [Kofleriaceae bacterium]MCB9571920.1 NADH-quinone oxidoreductase subunit I [Kofleriaceae bacterium]